MFRRPPGESAGATRPNERSPRARCRRRPVPDNARVLSIYADIGWHNPAGKPSINSRTNDRRTDDGKLAGWRQLGVRRSTAVVLINNFV